MTDPVFRDEVSIPLVIRVGCLCAAAVLFVLPARDLWHALWPPSVLTPVFGLLVLGAMLLGLVFLAVAFGSASTTIEVSGEGLVVERRWPWARRRTVYAPGSIDDVRVHKSSWTDGPDSWHVEIVAGGKVVARTRSHGTQTAAKTRADEIRCALGR
jgi:hypothetical protein